VTNEVNKKQAKKNLKKYYEFKIALFSLLLLTSAPQKPKNLAIW